MTTASLTEQLAKWLVEQREQGLADDVLPVAQSYVLDWLGSVLAGAATSPGKILCDYAGPQGTGPCHIIGTELCGLAETAALVNGGLSHIVEMDDLDRGSVVHPAAVVIPAALAVAEREGATGCDFLRAVVAGYEVAIRIGEAVGKRHYVYYHNTATCGIFGAAAAVGWLLGLDDKQLVWAWGNAGTQAAGLWQFNNEGDMSKHLHAGMAAANGVRAADLARRNFTGARHILEGQRGFFAATAPDANPELVVAGLDKHTYKIGGVSIKPYASCRHTHPAIDAALAVRARLAGRQIESCRIDTYQAALDLCDNPDPHTPYAARFSLHYCVTLALIHGQVGLVDFTPPAIARSAARKLPAQTTVKHNVDFEQRYPAQWPARVTVTLDDGTCLSEQVLHPKGDPENALDKAELTAKFCRLASYGGHARAAEAWLKWLDSLLAAQPLSVPTLQANQNAHRYQEER